MRVTAFSKVAMISLIFVLVLVLSIKLAVDRQAAGAPPIIPPASNPATQ